jgi:Ca-activated chloride channel family protein
MTKLTPSKLLILLAFMTSAFLLAACSPSAEKLNNQGNEAFAKEDYLVALHEYQSAQIESPELAEPYYNAANALYREGAYAEALEQMQLALQHVEDESLAENSIYNLGNTFYNTQELDPAIDSYISALLLDPDDQDAKYNLELALQQQQQQEQQQEQEQQQQEQENQEQEQDQSESSENQDEEQQSQEDQSQNGEEQQEQKQENQSQNSENQEQDQENESEQGSEEQSPENEDQQNEEEQNQDQNNSSGQPQDSQEQSDQQGQTGELPPGQRMTEEQARQLLEALAQDMDTLQERLGQILRVQIPPPVQDW